MPTIPLNFRLWTALTGCLFLLLLAPAVRAGVITGLYDTGTTGWLVSGGVCPTGTGTCTAGTPFLNSPVYVPNDAAAVDPMENGELWYVTSLGPKDSSQWIVPALRTDGTVKYPPSTPVGQDMDFGFAVYEFAITFQVSDPSRLVGIRGNYWIDGKLAVSGALPANILTANTTGDCGIQLNSVCYDQFFVAPTASYASTGNPFFLDQGFVAGANTLIFRSVNSNREVGLRADLEPLTVPEPASVGLVGAGLFGLWWPARRRRA